SRKTCIGHTGTLDPLATGVMVLCIGQATRLAEYVQRMSKTYRTTLRLGARSDTDDAEGAVEPVVDSRRPSRDEVLEAANSLIGQPKQVPPVFSAAKVKGRRAYELARAGRAVDLAPRTVHIYRIEVLRYDFPYLELEIDCSRGTYIRSLARDLGDCLE